jgi:hypothetical protein
MGKLRKLAVVAGAAQAARVYAKKNPEKVNRLADQAARFADRATKGKYHGKIDEAVRKVHQATGRPRGRHDTP